MDDGLVFGLEQGGKARIELYGEEVHDFQVFEHPEFPAAGVAVDNIGRFIRRLVDGEKVGAGCFGYKPGSEIGEEFDGVALLVEELKRSGVEDPEAVAKDLIERKCEFVLRPSSSG